MTTIVSCPTCQTQVEWISSNEHRPFCSKRCQLIDLGDWADENNKISQPAQGPQDLSEEMLDALEEQVLQNNKFFVEPE
jgi:endogenous inhibitor of DNA gyrase (YacG/DUF329 family)